MRSRKDLQNLMVAVSGILDTSYSAACGPFLRLFSRRPIRLRPAGFGGQGTGFKNCPALLPPPRSRASAYVLCTTADKAA
jgi:hypothetical protein